MSSAAATGVTAPKVPFTATQGTTGQTGAPAATAPKQAQGYNWSKIAAYTVLGAGVAGGLVVVAAAVFAVAGSKNVFQMGNQYGFASQPLTFSATTGSYIVGAIALGSVTALIGGGVWVHKEHQKQKAEEKAAQDAIAEAARLQAQVAQDAYIAKIDPSKPTFDKAFFNQQWNDDLILPLIVGPDFNADALIACLEQNVFDHAVEAKAWYSAELNKANNGANMTPAQGQKLAALLV